DYQQGGRFTVAYGRATDINYAYTGPMMRGVKLGKDELVGVLAKTYGEAAVNGMLAPVGGISGFMNMSGAQQVGVLNGLKGKLLASGDATLSGLAKNLEAIGDKDYAFTYYAMGDDVHMGWGEDEDVPVAYASYIYKDPGQWEFHAYGMKALGPVGHICKAYGFAGAYNITPMWRVQGEYVKNLRKLPLNNERPQSYNLGLHYGTANVLNAKSFSIGLDYVHSEAGTYFGGSSNDIVDQYMGHMYSSWSSHNRKMPAYFADKIDALLSKDPDAQNRKFGGAKFYLAKAEFVPMKGLIIEADYGFNAKDMGNKKMDNMFMLKATAYIK
ncbi:MAG TPA: S-layer homology domain-containing protein, partial [Dialister sp.]|nr:S-layer homology domain-containing protein [Dialister sp.]